MMGEASFRETQKPFAIDIFSGCGGLTLGLRKAGFSVVAAIEFDSLAASTFRLNHKRTRMVESDIRDVNPLSLRKELGLMRGDLDLLAGCPPCQGFSRLKTLNGTVTQPSAENDLIYSVFPFVSAFFPKTIMLENVPGLFDDYRLIALEEFLQKLGYNFQKRIVDASRYGVPQRRRRLIFMASRVGEFEFPNENKRRRSVKGAIGRLKAPCEGGRIDPLHDYRVSHSEKVRKIISLVPKNGGSKRDLDVSLQLDCHKKTTGFSDVYGRMSWKSESPTITGGCINPSKGRFIHPYQDRAITLREASLLQGFPKSYRFSLEKGRYPAAQMIGNAFPPRFAQIHAQKLFDLVVE